MKFIQLLVLATAGVVFSACSSQSTTHTQAAAGADATLVIREGQVMRLATGGTGRGTLLLHGWQYPFEVQHMVLAGLGPGDVQFEGDVFNLGDVANFEGTYKIVATEIESGEGAQGFWFENEKGVRVHIRSEGQDVTIRITDNGSQVNLL